MSEWWTYTLADFLMFSSRSYWRLIALYNDAVWPLHLLALAAGAVLVGCVARPAIRTRRMAALLLAAAWGWVAWAYHLERYADINTGATYFALAFALQALLLCFLALRPGEAPRSRVQHRVAMGVTGLAVLAFPLLALAAGRGWRQAELFGIAPDPTVLATLGVLLAWRAHPVAWLIPLAWCAVSGATLMELRVGLAWLLPAFAVLTVLAGCWPRRAINSSTDSRT